LTINKYILGLIGVVVAYVLFAYYSPKPINWQPTYQNTDKIPFGTRVVYELLPGLLRQPSVESLRVPVYNHLTDDSLPARSNYIFVCNTLDLSDDDRDQLLGYVRRGNHVFVSAYYMDDSLGSVLGVKAEVKRPTLRDTALMQNFTNPALSKPGGYNFNQDDGRNYLLVKRANDVTVLARNARREPTFVRVAYGKGEFLLHTLPLALTNYYALNDTTSDFAPKALSYLPPLPTYWDEYQKQGRFDADNQSILRYIWSQPSLSWAYYVAVIGLLLYMIFAGKRTQRVIPVVERPRNTSLEFVRTVGRMYFQQGNHNDLGHKRIQYFLANVRDRYNLPTTTLDAPFADALARKSGVPLDTVQPLIAQIREAQRSVSLTETDLLAINAGVEAFNREAS
jgi:hypothetical protein